jgi:hypothetical protein
MTRFDSITFTISQHFLPALINGDWTGMDDEDEALFTSWFQHATADWTDSEGTVWTYAHEDVVPDSENEFGPCDATCLYSAVVDVVIFFRPV